MIEQQITTITMLTHNLRQFLVDLEKVTTEHYSAYAENLRTELENGEKASSTTSSYIAAINSVFEVFGSGNHISAKESGIARGNHYDNTDKSASNEV